MIDSLIIETEYKNMKISIITLILSAGLLNCVCLPTAEAQELREFDYSDDAQNELETVGLESISIEYWDANDGSSNLAGGECRRGNR